jgi:type I restriction enzyme, S subunit
MTTLRDELKSNAGGAATPILNKTAFSEIEVSIPPLPVQRRIAGILSGYDELIENSQRRIQLLEAMARALYREWFVHFRFPGHEKLPRVASPFGDIPGGWEVKRLDAVCESVQDGDWIETKDQGGSDYRLLQISNVGVGEFIDTGNFRFVTQATFDRLRCTEIIPDDILVARMPTPIGRAWLATAMPWRMITAVDVAIIRAQANVLHPLFLAQAWNEPFNLQRIAGQASGTTRLRITRRELAALEFVVPPIEIQLRFAKVVEPQMEMIQALGHQIQNLRRTRDLLLPRLLCGQIDVEAA